MGGINGAVKLRYVKDIYPFISDKMLKEVNKEFDVETTAETYIIQYLINKKGNNIKIVLDGGVYYISNTIHLRSWIKIVGTRNEVIDDFSQRMQMPGNRDICVFYTSSVLMMCVPDKNMFDSGDKVLQNVVLENFGAVGIMGKIGFNEKYSGDFFHQTSKISKCEFRNLSISHFNNGFYKTMGWIWSNFERLYVNQIRFNGLYLYSDNSQQLNACLIRDCRFFHCGMEYKGGELVDLNLDTPSIQKGNCVVLGGSGNVIDHCDFSHSCIGVFLQSYSNGTTVSATYSEGIKISTFYEDYDPLKSNLSSKIDGGYHSVKKKTQKSQFKYN